MFDGVDHQRSARLTVADRKPPLEIGCPCFQAPPPTVGHP